MTDYREQAVEVIQNAERTETSDTFDRIVGQAAMAGTLNIPNLLAVLRMTATSKQAFDMDLFAHTVLEL